MKRVLLTLSVTLVALAATATVSAQGKAASQSAPVAAAAAQNSPASDDRLWSLTLTVHPDSAKRAADDLVKLVKDPSAPAPTLLGNVLGIFGAELASTTAAQAAAKKTNAQGPMASMATSACAAAVDALGQQASVVRSGYDTLAAGMPAEKVAALQQQIKTLTEQLAAATRSAVESASKASGQRKQ